MSAFSGDAHVKYTVCVRSACLSFLHQRLYSEGQFEEQGQYFMRYFVCLTITMSNIQSGEKSGQLWCENMNI